MDTSSTETDARPNKRKTPDSTERQRDEEWYLEDGDVTLISSDQVVFKIHRYHLQAASPVFRAMFTTCEAASEVELHDDILETAIVLRRFFLFIYRGVIKNSMDTQIDLLTSYMKLHRFMLKYDMTIFINYWKHPLFENLRHIYLFIMGAETGEYEICSKAIREGCNVMWQDKHSAREVEHCVHRACPFDFGSLSYRVLCLIPPIYLHAFLRAVSSNKMETREESRGLYWKYVADEFEILIKKYPADLRDGRRCSDLSL